MSILKMFRHSTYVANAGRILLLALFLVRKHEELLKVLDDHLPRRPHLAGLEQMTRFPHHGMPRVVVGHSEYRTCRFHGLAELVGLLEAVGHGLVADGVEAGFRIVSEYRSTS